MTDGFALAGGGPAPRRRGRPPGAKNKRAADLAGYLDVRCGGTAALQLAQGCMVTSAEVKAAGSLQAAELVKARRMVEAFDREAAQLDQDVRAIVRQELAALVAQADVTTKASAVLAMVAGCVDRMQDSRRMGLLQALDRMGEDRRALLPYTDQRQAQRVEVKDSRAPPVMVFQGGSTIVAIPQGNQSAVIEGVALVSPSQSHDDVEAEPDQ
jgi:hypothetical protein